MRQIVRVLVILLALAEIAFWSVILMALGQWGHSMAGMSAGSVPRENTGDTLFTAVLWLLIISPYACIVAGSLNCIRGRGLRVAFIYSLAILSIMTMILLMSSLVRLELAALGNVVLASVWIFLFRATARTESDIARAS
jgi:hypothetical protein